MADINLTQWLKIHSGLLKGIKKSTYPSLFANNLTQEADQGRAAALIGGDQKDAAIASDYEVKKALEQDTSDTNSNAYQDLLKKFQDSPLSGCITILDMARRASGWNPFEPDTNGN